jgi:hypothetical protein
MILTPELAEQSVSNILTEARGYRFLGALKRGSTAGTRVHASWLNQAELLLRS